MTVYQYVIGGEMTPAAAVDGSRTPAALVREINTSLGLSMHACKAQAAIDLDDVAVIGVSATVSLARDERKRR